MKHNLASNLDRFSFADIEDLDAASITGGAGATVTASANAYGPNPATYTNTSATADNSPLFSLAYGQGSALAIGDAASTNVNTSATGDKVKTISKTIDVGGQSLSVGVVVAYNRKY